MHYNRCLAGEKCRSKLSRLVPLLGQIDKKVVFVVAWACINSSQANREQRIVKEIGNGNGDGAGLDDRPLREMEGETQH